MTTDSDRPSFLITIDTEGDDLWSAPKEITTLHIYVGVIPFVAIQLAALVLLWFLPGLATWLPQALYGR